MNLQNTLTIVIVLQDNNSEFSLIMPGEFGEQLTRVQRPFLQSLQILQIHKFMLVLLLFSSSHSFSIGFSSGDWDGHGRSLILCSVTHFCVDLMFVLDHCLAGRSNHGPL